MPQTKYILTFKDIRQRLELEEEWQENVEIIGAEATYQPLIQKMILKGRTKRPRLARLSQLRKLSIANKTKKNVQGRRI